MVFQYAHLEGFCRFALKAYVRAINATGLSCQDAEDAIAAASLADLFKALRNPDSKCAIFRNVLPDDSDLHRFARDREFVSNATVFLRRRVCIGDELLEPGSNLTPKIIQKCLYRVGLPHDAFREFEGRLQLLLNRRNPIAHGEQRGGVSKKDFEEIQLAAGTVMSEMARLITDAIARERFRKTPGGTAGEAAPIVNAG